MTEKERRLRKRRRRFSTGKGELTYLTEVKKDDKEKDKGKQK